MSYFSDNYSRLTFPLAEGERPVLGEGFDMPRLKVAAVHSPHRSLAVTLQFIGRFARTAGERLGEATFLATASGVKVEAEKLYSAGAIWADIIPNLSAARVQREVEAREFIETFERDVGTIPDLSDMSLYSLSPYAHVKIYRLREPFDINAVPNFGADREQICDWAAGGPPARPHPYRPQYVHARDDRELPRQQRPAQKRAAEAVVSYSVPACRASSLRARANRAFRSS
ncbi:hypothetical protein ACFKHW_04325 [Bradyrhizobium lupini]|uniref:hypothetical protein n=1 Tax=Rhizobium lupini TaxID=136996 RepID=UPI003672A1E6